MPVRQVYSYFHGCSAETVWAEAVDSCPDGYPGLPLLTFYGQTWGVMERVTQTHPVPSGPCCSQDTEGSHLFHHVLFL